MSEIKGGRFVCTIMACLTTIRHFMLLADGQHNPRAVAKRSVISRRNIPGVQWEDPADPGP